MSEDTKPSVGRYAKLIKNEDIWDWVYAAHEKLNEASKLLQKIYLDPNMKYKAMQCVDDIKKTKLKIRQLRSQVLSRKETYANGRVKEKADHDIFS